MEHVCKNPRINIKTTNTHQKHFKNKRLKRSSTNLRIYRHYDDSFNLLANSEELKIRILEPAIQFWEQTLLVKSPMVSPILFDRECNQGYSNIIFNTERIKVCNQKCIMDQKCHKTIIPHKFLSKCYEFIDNNKTTVKSNGENGEGAQNADLLLLITHISDSCNNNTMAYATVCYLEEDLNRPVLGLINLCPNQIKTGINTDSAIATIKHEIVHILGLTPSLFSFFRDENGQPLTSRDSNNMPNLGTKVFEDAEFYKWSDKTVIEKSYTFQYRTGKESRSVFIMVTPNIKKEARRYFNCSSLEGLYLEDSGSTNNILSHFEKRIFSNELMTPTISVYSLVSRFTLAFLQDTGWYETDYAKADKLEFAHGAGCDFLRKSCYEYINQQISKNQSVYPYCNQVVDQFPLKCSADLRSTIYCNLFDLPDLDIPVKYRYFNNINLVSSDQFSDYCPFEKVYVKTNGNNAIFNGVCTNTRNNVIQNTEHNIFSEKFGSNSACIMHDKSQKWSFASCGEWRTPTISGAGCYTYNCSTKYRMIIEINNIKYQCKKDGQIINVATKNKHLLSFGNLLCPKCSLLCNEMECNSNQTLPTIIQPIKCHDQSCLNKLYPIIPCSSFILKFANLYYYLFVFLYFILFFKQF